MGKYWEKAKKVAKDVAKSVKSSAKQAVEDPLEFAVRRLVDPNMMGEVGLEVGGKALSSALGGDESSELVPTPPVQGETDEERIERLKKEAQAAARKNAPGISSQTSLPGSTKQLSVLNIRQ